MLSDFTEFSTNEFKILPRKINANNLVEFLTNELEFYLQKNPDCFESPVKMESHQKNPQDFETEVDQT